MTASIVTCEQGIALFLGRSHLQYLIAYSMQIRRGRFGHMRLRQVDRW